MELVMLRGERPIEGLTKFILGTSIALSPDGQEKIRIPSNTKSRWGKHCVGDIEGMHFRFVHSVERQFYNVGFCISSAITPK